mmetsp:Transcript_19852/g.48138  ORF Transcript_19852/g.48138 Transcript_19852/m.48138 type:complete len:461 (-) Transcript_19852:51-1433(-)
MLGLEGVDQLCLGALEFVRHDGAHEPPGDLTQVLARHHFLEPLSAHIGLVGQIRIDLFVNVGLGQGAVEVAELYVDELPVVAVLLVFGLVVTPVAAGAKYQTHVDGRQVGVLIAARQQGAHRVVDDPMHLCVAALLGEGVIEHLTHVSPFDALVGASVVTTRVPFLRPVAQDGVVLLVLLRRKREREAEPENWAGLALQSLAGNVALVFADLDDLVGEVTEELTLLDGRIQQTFWLFRRGRQLLEISLDARRLADLAVTQELDAHHSEVGPAHVNGIVHPFLTASGDVVDVRLEHLEAAFLLVPVRRRVRSMQCQPLIHFFHEFRDHHDHLGLADTKQRPDRLNLDFSAGLEGNALAEAPAAGHRLEIRGEVTRSACVVDSHRHVEVVCCMASWDAQVDAAPLPAAPLAVGGPSSVAEGKPPSVPRTWAAVLPPAEARRGAVRQQRRAHPSRPGCHEWHG